MFLKICGMTRLPDALHAASHGAHAVGFVFWPESPRFVSPEQAAAIIEQLPRHVTPVGVFVNESPDRIRKVADQAGIMTVQLHGDENARSHAAVSLPILRAIGVEHAEEEFASWPPETVFLLDATDRVRRGGTGQTVDRRRAAALAARRRVVLAGGLTAENVADAISAVQPFGVDVSSGVEDAPGVKNPDKVARFLACARSAFEQHEIRHR